MLAYSSEGFLGKVESSSAVDSLASSNLKGAHMILSLDATSISLASANS